MQMKKALGACLFFMLASCSNTNRTERVLGVRKSGEKDSIVAWYYTKSVRKPWWGWEGGNATSIPVKYQILHISGWKSVDLYDRFSRILLDKYPNTGSPGINIEPGGRYFRPRTAHPLSERRWLIEFQRTNEVIFILYQNDKMKILPVTGRFAPKEGKYIEIQGENTVVITDKVAGTSETVYLNQWQRW